MNHAPGEHIHDLHRIITEAGEDHALALGIDREVVQAPLDTRQRYFLDFAHRGRLALIGVGDSAQRDQGAGAD